MKSFHNEEEVLEFSPLCLQLLLSQEMQTQLRGLLLQFHCSFLCSRGFFGEEKNKPGIYTLLLNQLLPLLPSQTTPLERRGSRAPKCHRGPRTANRTRWRAAGPSWGAAAAPRLPPIWGTGLRSAGPGWGW